MRPGARLARDAISGDHCSQLRPWDAGGAPRSERHGVGTRLEDRAGRPCVRRPARPRGVGSVRGVRRRNHCRERNEAAVPRSPLRGELRPQAHGTFPCPTRHGIDEPSLPIRGAHGEDERRRHGGLGGVPLVGGDEEDGDRHGRIPVLHEGYDEQPRCHTGRPKRRLQAGDRRVRLVQRCAPGASRAKSPGRTRLRCGNC